MYFPVELQVESVSHYLVEKRDALSGWDSGGNCVPFWALIPGRSFPLEPVGKTYPRMATRSRAHFPLCFQMNTL